MAKTKSTTSEKTFTCVDCGQIKSMQTSGGTGYANRPEDDKYGKAGLVCYDCCGKQDLAYMQDNDRTTLYLTKKMDDITIGKGLNRVPFGALWEVSNWPGTLRMPAVVTKGTHNLVGVRHDAWFTDPNGNKWHGVQYGRNTDIVHCRKLKTKRAQQSDAAQLSSKLAKDQQTFAAMQAAN